MPVPCPAIPVIIPAVNAPIAPATIQAAIAGDNSSLIQTARVRRGAPDHPRTPGVYSSAAEHEVQQAHPQPKQQQQQQHEDEWKSYASSAEQPSTAPERDPRMTIKSLDDIFAKRSEEPRVKKLLTDVATLRAWQSEASASNKLRDAMMKLGSIWNVPQKAAGKKRAPQDVSADLEHEFLAFAERLWNRRTPFSSTESAVKPSLKNTLPKRIRRRIRHKHSVHLQITLHLKRHMKTMKH